MDASYSIIEKYLNNELNEKERAAFEEELKSNPDLQQRLVFYKQLRLEEVDSKPSSDFKFKGTILPSILDTATTHTSAPKEKRSNALMLPSIIVIAVLTAAFLFLYLPTRNKLNQSTIAHKAKQDSLTELIESMHVQLAGLTNRIDSNASIEQPHADNGNLLAEINSHKQTINQLKDELAQAKQELYQNSHVAGNSAIKNFTAKLTGKLSLFWECEKSVNLKVYDLSGKIIAQNNAASNEFSFAKPTQGFYRIHLIPQNMRLEQMLIEVKANSVKIWKQN